MIKTRRLVDKPDVVKDFSKPKVGPAENLKSTQCSAYWGQKQAGERRTRVAT
jgi:hypothetical protein